MSVKKNQTVDGRVPALPGLAPAVSALVEAAVMQAQGEKEPLHEASFRRSREVMLRRLGMMPRFLGIPMMLATLMFDWSGLLLAGRPFRWQSYRQRCRQMRQWRSLPISFCENFVDFYEKMATFAYFSDLCEREGQGDG